MNYPGKVILAILIAFGVEAAPTLAQNVVGVSADAASAAHDWREAHEKQILEDFVELLSLPNYGGNDADIRANAAHIRAMFEARGVTTQLLEYEGGPPAVYGELMTPGASETVVLYVHYDGQPTLSGGWVTPPFEPTLRAGRMEDDADIMSLADVGAPINPDWRIYARSTSDDKAPLIALVTALDAMNAAGIAPSINLKFFFEGEEEMGSPHLKAMLAKYKDLLAADFWLFLDGPRDRRGNPRVHLGVRGSFGVDLTVYGPVRGLHSGHYGNFAPNPIARLAHLIAGMRNEDSRILIDGFYQDVVGPSSAERALIKAIPEGDADMMEAAGLGGRESIGLRYEETILWPALNIRGISGGEVGDAARNIIVPSATAAIGFRLVPNQTPERIIELFEQHITGEGYDIIYEDPDLDTRLASERLAKLDWSNAGYAAVRTSPDDARVQKLIRIMDAASAERILVYPSLGGSLPLAHVVDVLGVPLVNIPIANEDNSQHAPNENIRIGNLWDGIAFYAAILAGLGVE